VVLEQLYEVLDWAHERVARRAREDAVTPEDTQPCPASSPYPETILQFFEYRHLPPELQSVSRLFYELARVLVETLPRNAERTVALRKLLEGKDAAVRARLAK
jgi:hypothetical protein